MRGKDALRRIHILGGPGTGKTTLAYRMGAALDVPVYKLDTVALEGPEFRQRPLDERLSDIHRIAVQDAWITEGIYVGWTDELLNAADAIIWLDHVPWPVAFARILRRFVYVALIEFRRQRGVRKFTRLGDYRRNFRQLVDTFFSSRTYYHPSSDAEWGPARQLTRHQTIEHLARYEGKVIHCKRPREIELALQRVTRSPALLDGPLVSIIVNNHNYGQFVTDAIESALRQRYSNVEVIVVDDGSTDDSRERISRYADRVLPLFKENGGQASAFNVGFKASRGDVIIFLDADDLLLPDTVAYVAEAFTTHPGLAKVQYRMEVVDDRGIASGEVLPADHLHLANGDMRRYILNFPEDMTWMGTSGNAFARSVLSQILPMPESAYDAGGADWYLSHLTPLLGDVRWLDLIGAHRRVHRENLYHRSRPSLEQIRRTIHYMCTTRQYVSQFSQEHTDLMGEMPSPGVPGDSVSFLAHRLISLKLDPSQHPISGDSASDLLLRAVWASSRRFDVRFPMKALYVVWFALMAVAPRRLAIHLADAWLYPGRLGAMTHLLGALHRS